MTSIKIDTGYQLMQDVHSLGEHFGIYKPEFDAKGQANSHCISPFEPIAHLGHLQLLLEKQPYFGRNLRYFNYAPWWYKVKFFVPADAPKKCVLRVGAADYFCDVYLNGVKLGAHEGYFAPFEFRADDAVKRGCENVAVLRVSSPWDEEKHDGASAIRCWNIIRNMMKGTYEHADSFLSRDVNPVGLLEGIQLDFFDEARIAGVQVNARLEGDDGRLCARVALDGDGGALRLRLTDARTGELVAKAASERDFDVRVERVNKWTTPDRGECGLYKLEIQLIENGKAVQTVTRTVGFRTIDLVRTNERTEYYLNGERLYVRGATYFPEVYVSRMDKSRYLHDLTLLKAAGMNMIRVHVHVENSALYELCDEMGMLVMQDTDLNWVQNRSDEFAARALNVFDDMISTLGHHPCIATWVLYNEPDRRYDDFYMNVQPAPQMEAMAREKTPGIPTIRGSYIWDAAHSGDSHNYTGSLYGEEQHYLDKQNNEKLNTEFGFDSPGGEKNLQSIHEVWAKLNKTQAEIDVIDEYQYRYTKHFIEHYRVHKYDKCAGYIQFLFSDPVPASFYGALDWWGAPKGAYRAMLESNQPFAAILEHDTQARALWAVSDVNYDVRARLVTVSADSNGNILARVSDEFLLPADDKVRVRAFTDVAKGGVVALALYDADTGRLLSSNRYVDPLTHPKHPAGHPDRMNNDLTMHLFTRD